MKFLSVCSGIEAASMAWHSLGWRPVAFSETDKFASAVLAHHYPNVPNLGDMNKFKEWPDADVDVLVGGTPCQSFSVAGLRGGLGDARGNLMLVYAAIARRYRPKWVVWENVPGVLSDDGGLGFASLLGILSGRRVETPKEGWESAGTVPGIESAYGLAWRVLDAQFVRVDTHARAVPQRRKRVFVVGHLGDWRRAAAVLFERDSLSGHPAPRRQAGERPAPTLSAHTQGGGGLGTDFDLDGGLVAGTLGTALDRHATTQDAFAGNLVPLNDLDGVSHALRGEGFDASEDGTGRGTPLVPICFSAKDYGADAMENLSPTLRSGGHDKSHANAGVMPAIAFHARQDPDSGPVTHPLDTDGSSVGILQNWRVRRLMPVECERLQGFPDGFTNIPYPKPKWAPKFPDRVKYAADGPRYKALGNSFAVNVVRWIGQRIEMVSKI